MLRNRITLITLGVRELDAAAAFYEALGLVAEDSPPGVMFYDMGGFKFGLFTLPELAQEQRRTPESLGTGAMTLAVNFPTEADVDVAFAEALAAGGTPLSPPAKTEWGGYSSYWADPDGHVWEYAFNPFWPLDESGRLASG